MSTSRIDGYNAMMLINLSDDDIECNKNTEDDNGLMQEIGKKDSQRYKTKIYYNRVSLKDQTVQVRKKENEDTEEEMKYINLHMVMIIAKRRQTDHTEIKRQMKCILNM